MQQPGDAFPAFSLPDQDGTIRTPRSFAGKWLVAYFYPKDNTSGCTLEAQTFAARFADFSGKNAVILGVSPDSIKCHAGFAARHSLPFILLSDPEHALLEACGVWQKKKMAGREYMGVVRTTMLVDPRGTVRAVWPKVKVPGHADGVLNELARLMESGAGG